jgi:hypothetical protein
VCTLIKIAVGVNPGEKTGDVIDFREVYLCLVELYLTACYEFTLVYTVVYLFI